MAPAMPAEMMSLSQMPCAMPQTNQVNQVIVLVADPSTFPVAPVNYVAWCPQHSFQVPVPPLGPAGPALSNSLALPSSPSATQISPCAVGPGATPRTDVPSDDSDRDDSGARPRCSASTARRLRRKRAAERAKVANASGAPKVGMAWDGVLGPGDATVVLFLFFLKMFSICLSGCSSMF